MNYKKFSYTQGEIKELVRYQKSTGRFYWKIRSVEWFKGSESRTPEHTMKLWNSRHAGERCDLLNKSTGERRLTIQGDVISASRLAFLYVTGEMPEEAGHVNKRMGDNRWCNLIESNNYENRKNRVQRKGKSGICGVSKHDLSNSWQAKIGSKSIGYFKSFLDACCARKSAEFKKGYGTHFNKDFK